MKSGNQFGIGINGNEYPLVANFKPVNLPSAAIFLADKSPDFVDRKYLGCNPRILVSISLLLRSPATTKRRMIVLRFKPVSRSVVRIEQPSTRHWIALAAVSGLDSNVLRVSLAWGSEKRVLQDVHFQR